MAFQNLRFKNCEATILFSLLTSMVCLIPGSALAAGPQIQEFEDPATGRQVRYIRNELVVGFRAAALASERSSLLGRLPAVTSERAIGANQYVIRFDANIDPILEAETLEHNPAIEFAHPNFVGSFETLPTDPGLGEWWFLDSDPSDGIDDPSTMSTLNLLEFWQEYESIADHSDVAIVLFDTGLDVDHVDFKDHIGLAAAPGNMSNRIVLFESYLEDAETDSFPPNGYSQESSPRDFAGHGTAMAGVASAIASTEAGEGVAGVAYDSPLWIYKVGYSNGDEADVKWSDFYRALQDLKTATLLHPQKRFVANLSLGFEYLDTSSLNNLIAIVDELLATQKVLIVAAAGNEDDAFWEEATFPNPPSCVPPSKSPNWYVKYPAALSGCHLYPDYDNVLAVGSVRLFESTAEGPCDCNGPPNPLSRRAWAEFSRYIAPEPNHPNCAPIVDFLVAGGARPNSSADPGCAELNVYSSELCGSGDGTDVSCALFGSGYGTSYSTAIASAVSAGIWAKDLTLTPGDIKDLLMTYSDRTAIHDVVDGAVVEEMLTFGTSSDCANPPIPDDPSIGLLGSESEVFDFSGKAGAGVLNAGRAIRNTADRDVEYITSGTPSANLTIGGADVLVLAGDLHVPSGLTLTIDPGGNALQPLRVETTPDGAEIVVDGTLELLGDTSLATYDRSTAIGAWGGVRVTSTGSLITNGHSLRIRNAVVGLDMQSAPSEMILEASYCEVGARISGDFVLAPGSKFEQNTGRSLESPDGGFFFAGGLEVVSGPGLDVRGSTGHIYIDGEVSLDGPAEFASLSETPSSGDWMGIVLLSPFTSNEAVTVRHASVALANAEVLNLTNWDISNCGTALVSFAAAGHVTLQGCTISNLAGNAILGSLGNNLTISGLQMQAVAGSSIDKNGGVLVVDGSSEFVDSQGMVLSNLAPGSVVRNCSILNSQYTPLLVSGGSLELGPGLVVDGSGSVFSGIVVNSNATLSSGGLVSAENCSVEGISIDGGVLSGNWLIESRFNGASGLRLTGANIALASGSKLSANADNGLYAFDAGVTCQGCSFNGNGVAGVEVDGASTADIRNSSIQNNVFGVNAGEDAEVNLGDLLTDGNNNFSGNTFKHVANLNAASVVQAVGNYWGPYCPPKSTKFLGQVNHANCLTTAP